MLKINFCDDNPIQLKKYYQLAKNSIFLQDWEIEMGIAARTPDELLEHIISSEESGLYFLDIELKAALSGFELAQQIRIRDPKAFLIFITSHEEYAMETYKYRLEAMDFIVKSENKERMQERIFLCIQTAYQRYCDINKNDDEVLTLKSGSNIFFLPCTKVLYIKNSEIPHHISINTGEALLDYPGTLSNIQKRHFKIFVKCSRSILVNRYHIKSMHMAKRELVLDNGECLSCSFRAIPELRKLCE